MNIDQLKTFTFEMLESHKRIIKPWKHRRDAENNDNDCHAQGWNACLLEMEKQHKKFMAYIRKQSFEQGVPEGVRYAATSARHLTNK